MGLFDRIKRGLSRTRENVGARMDELVELHEDLTEEFYEDLTDILIMADVGVKTAQLVVDRLRERCEAEKIPNTQKARQALKDILVDLMGSEPMKLTSPMVLLVIGVNGVGKTTSIGKLAARLRTVGRSVIICAGDTFRAAAIEQLEVWAERADVPIIKHAEGADPAAVVYDTISAAKARHADVVICDTAGRLHNKKNLMDELSKISRIIDKGLPGCSKEVLLVLDATTGQNAVNQAREFKEAAGLTGIVLTKLDGTAKGGVVLAIHRDLGLPVKFIGVGEQVDDLQPFDAEDFARALFERRPEA